MIPGNTSSQGKYVDPPTSVSASISDLSAIVSFTLPVHDGKGVATYSVVSTPGGLTASGASSPLTVNGLSYSTSYTFVVTAIGGYGIDAVSSASSAVSTGAAPPFFPPFFPSFGPFFPPFFPFFPPFFPPFFGTGRICFPGNLGFYGCNNPGDCGSFDASGSIC